MQVRNIVIVGTVGWAVRVFVTRVNCSQTAERIDVIFDTHVGVRERNIVLHGHLNRR